MFRCPNLCLKPSVSVTVAIHLRLFTTIIFTPDFFLILIEYAILCD